MIVGVSGPDGSGKSTTVDALLARLAESGNPAWRLYAYGCAICRHCSPPKAIAMTVGSAHGEHRPRPLRLLHQLHGFVDLTDLVLRLSATIIRTRLCVPGGSARIVVTDRSPLDGLVRYMPRPGGALAGAYLWLARRYDLIILLDAGAAELARRDREHSFSELACVQRAYAAWRYSIEKRVVYLDNEGGTTTDMIELAWRALRPLGSGVWMPRV